MFLSLDYTDNLVRAQNVTVLFRIPLAAYLNIFDYYFLKNAFI